MSRTHSTGDRPIAAAAPPKRSVRGVAVAAATATLSGVLVALGAGSASALPPLQCSGYQYEVTIAVQQMNYWSQRFDDDFDAGDWSAWSTDLASYNSAADAVVVAKAMARQFGC